MTSESSESSYTTQDGGASVLHRLEPVRALSAMRQHELSALCATEDRAAAAVDIASGDDRE